MCFVPFRVTTRLPRAISSQLEINCHELVCEELKGILLEMLGNVGFGPTLHKKPLKMLNSSLSLVMVIPDQ